VSGIILTRTIKRKKIMATKKTQTKPELSFLTTFNKEIDKIEGVGRSSQPPRFWYSFGNYALNAVMSGNYFNGIPQGRITGIVGPSGAGKSFVVGNIIKSAQKDNAIVLVVDSENALDNDYMSKIGVNTSSEAQYYYTGVSTVSQVIKVVSNFIKGYKQQFGESEDAPKVLIAIDSLNMLQTESSAENYDKGIQKGDQGQKAKQVKSMLMDFVQDIKTLNISMVVTGHVYKNMDVLNGEGVWIVNDGMRFSLSQILLVTKLKLRDKVSKEFEGITMKGFGFKSRFCSPFQSVSLDVPYQTGIDVHSGLLEIAIAKGIVQKSGSRYFVTGESDTWYSKDFHKVADKVLNAIVKSSPTKLSIDELEDMSE
jgi:recombination protein RecA